MNRATRAAAVLFVSLVGLWGCGQGPTATAQAERIKSLEAKSGRLDGASELVTWIEKDYQPLAEALAALPSTPTT